MVDLASQWVDEGNLLDIIDLGCGTGLCGDKFSKISKTLKGVDISPRMLKAASARGIYDELEENDILEALVRHQKDYDLAVSADTLPYLGELESVFLAINSALREGGLFLFTVEAHDGEGDFVLGATARYAHSRAYLEDLARRREFEMLACNDTVYRKEGGKDVPGFIVIMKKVQ